MKSYKSSKKIIYVVMIFIMIVMCMVKTSYASETPPPQSSSPGESEPSTQLPHIEMKVKAVKVGTTNQIRIECWGSNFTKLEGLDIVFTYDNTKLTPSNVSNNEIISNLDSIKKVPEKADSAFNKTSTEILSPAFQFNDDYKDKLFIDIFKYLAPEGNIEAMQFVMLKKDESPNIDAKEPVLLGTFSFQQKEGTIVNEIKFTTKAITIYCDDGLSEDDYSYYTKEEANGDDCTEIVKFIYEEYGSISGEVNAYYSYFAQSTDEYMDIDTIVTINLYNANDVAAIDWNATGTEYYKYREKIAPNYDGEYGLLARPMGIERAEIKPVQSITTTAEDKGKFTIENVEFGQYVLVIDKLDFSDYIVTNITIDSDHKEIDIGKARIEVGDFNKDGIINENDQTIFTRLYVQKEELEENNIMVFDFNDDGIISDNDTTICIRVFACLLANDNPIPIVKTVVDWNNI